MISSILDLDTQTNQYFYDSGYSDVPSPGSSSTSSRMVCSPASNSSDEVTPANLRYLNLSDSINPSLSYDVYRLNPVQLDFQNQRDKPELIITEQPVDKFRFRYKSEMHGTHGSLMGERTEKSKRTYPTVELRNFYGRALIRCSLYQTDSLKRLPHSHKLVVRNGEDDQCDPHDLFVSPEEGFRAVFQGMGIIHTAKKYIIDELISKKLKEKKFEVGRQLTTREESQIKISAEKEAKDMNLNQVCLAFHAYAINGDGTLSKLCDPVFSRPINNMKSALTGELKIVRLSAVVSSAAGGEDLFLLVEKVGKKNIKVRFYEVDDGDDIVWEDWGLFSEADVHHQYAIALRTPPYKYKDIDEDVHVFIQLERPSDGVRSEPVPFKYKPRDYVISRKRARTSSSSLSSLELPETIQYQNQKTTSTLINNRTLTLSEEFNKSEEINKLLNCSSQMQYDSEQHVPEDYINQVTMDSDELIKIMDTDFFETNDLETDGTTNRKSNVIKQHQQQQQQQQQRIAQSQAAATMKFKKEMLYTPTEWYLTYFKEIMKVLRMYMQSDFERAKAEVINIFKDANKNDYDLLHCAISDGNSVIVLKLLNWIKKLQIQEVLDFKNDRNETCLHIACLFDRPECILALIQLGVNPNFQDNKGNTPLHIAIMNNFTTCATKIIETSNYSKNCPKLEINFSNDDGLTPLHLAIRNGNLSLVKKIIEDGKASVKLTVAKDGNNPLHLAIQQKSEEIAKYLLESTSVDINQQNFNGHTPLELAYQMGGEVKPIVQLLLKRGGKMDIDSSNTSMTSPSTTTTTDSAGTTEDSSSEDEDDSEGQLKIDENQEFLDDDGESILLDSLCISRLASIFNSNNKWRLLAQTLNLNCYVCLWTSEDNPTEKMLNYINYNEVGNLKIGNIIDACEKLKEPDAVLCIKEMIKRHNNTVMS